MYGIVPILTYAVYHILNDSGRNVRPDSDQGTLWPYVQGNLNTNQPPLIKTGKSALRPYKNADF